MNENLPLKSRRDFFKMLDIEHLNNEEFQLLCERKLSKDEMCWAVLHLSECHQCCLVAPVLTEQEIKDALAGTSYGKADFIEQTVDYYFQTLKRR